MPTSPAVSRRPLSLLLAAVGLAAGLSLGLVACSSSGSAVSTGNSFGSAGRSVATTAGTGGSSGDKVTIKNYAFGPKALTVKVGTTVSWNNTDQFDHSVTQDDGGFTGDPIHPGATFSHTYATPGTYSYHCGIHNFMTGSVTVTS